MLFKEKNSNNFSYSFSKNYFLNISIEEDKPICSLSTNSFKLKERVFEFENSHILELIQEKNYRLSFIIKTMKKELSFVYERLNKLDY